MSFAMQCCGFDGDANVDKATQIKKIKKKTFLAGKKKACKIAKKGEISNFEVCIGVWPGH